MPPIENSCSTNADCELVDFDIYDPFTCCRTCGLLAGAPSWAARAKKYCEGASLKNCPSKFDCGPPREYFAECRDFVGLAKTPGGPPPAPIRRCEVGVRPLANK